MTVQFGGIAQEVRLSVRDYIAVVGIAMAILGAVVSFAIKNEADRARSDEKVRAVESRIVDMKSELTEMRRDIKALIENRK